MVGIPVSALAPLGAGVVATAAFSAAVGTASAQSAPRGAARPADAGADSAALALVERAAVAYGSARTLRASFVQTLLTPRSGDVQTARGEFLQRGASQFAFAFTEPAGDRIIADGEVIWLYLPSMAPGQVLKLPRAAGAGLDLASSLLHSPRERYSVRALADTAVEGQTLRRLTLTPRTQDAPFRTAELWIEPEDALVRRLVVAEPLGLVRTIDFTRIRVGGVIPDAAFVFTPPEGVRVIDQAALLGGSVPPKKP